MLLAVLTIILGMGALVSAVTYLLFWYEALNSPHPSHAEVAGGGSLGRAVLVGFLSSVSSQIMAYLSYPTGFARSLWKPKPSPSCTRPPVLLVHGLYHNASAWYLFKWLLRRAGYEKVFCWSYNTLKYDFWQLADQLQGILREASGLCGGEQVVLMGHSMGGLLTRAALADPRSAELIRAAVVMAAPNQGSKLAALAVGHLGRSLIHQGPLVQRLNALRPAQDVPRLNIFSPLDNMVLPTNSLEMPEPGWLEVQTAPVSHVSMLYHLPTLRLALEFLEETAGCAQREEPPLRADAQSGAAT